MRRVLRIALLAVLGLLLIEVVAGIASGTTGAAEKLALAAVGALLVSVVVVARHRLD